LLPFRQKGAHRGENREAAKAAFGEMRKSIRSSHLIRAKRDFGSIKQTGLARETQEVEDRHHLSDKKKKRNEKIRLDLRKVKCEVSASSASPIYTYLCRGGMSSNLI